MFYNGLPKEEVLKIHNFVMDKRKEGLGQRKLFELVKKEFKKEINEGTISGWIFRGVVPYANEKTQFKSKPIPPKEYLFEDYINKKLSAETLAKRYKVSTIIVINWLRYYGIKTRTHKESMNTPLIKTELREQKLTRPTKDFSKLTCEKAYVMGVLAGDACINKKVIRFEIRKDEEFIKKFSNCFFEIYGLKYNYSYYAKRNSFVLYVSSAIICEDLLKYGDFGTFEWKIPTEIYKSNNEPLFCSFLKGLFDSEGTASRYIVSMSSANKTGINQVSDLLNKLNIKNRVMTTKKGYYVLYITKRERLKMFRDKIGFTIQRKLNPIKDFL
ncbi:MAG: LAGLIDADG family homing endonuclease [Nanoarchaeota archaeon]